MFSNRFGLAVVAGLLWACSLPAGQLVSTTDEPVGDNCANGGLKAETGTDDDGDGTLDDGEVTDTSYVCNGSNGTNGTDGSTGSNGEDGTSVLTDTTLLDAGDSFCLEGGLRIDMGVDTNRDGLLQASEITTTQYICNGTPSFTVKPIDPPASPPGAYTVDATGGTGNTGNGGGGGDFTHSLDPATFGGHAKVFATGQADASFTFPAPATMWLGDHPLDVSEDTEPVRYTSGEPTDDGELHVHQNGGSYLYAWDDNAQEDVLITGMSVAAGVTLTLPQNYQETAWITFFDGVVNAGTITTTLASDGVSRRALTLSTRDYRGEADSLVDLRGGAGSGDVGGHGGSLVLTATGSIACEGDVDTSGGDGTAGGTAGGLSLSAGRNLANTGEITARGGTGSDGPGGSGGEVRLMASYGHVWTSGPLDASGGDGTTAGGSGGESLRVQAFQLGEVVNSGELTNDGGNATDEACVSDTCRGGDAGSIDLHSQGGRLISGGALHARGGNGTGGDGGAGGDVSFLSEYGDGYSGATVPGGDIVVSGNIVSRGGDGARGGDAGDVSAESSGEYVADSQEIIFLGYTSITLDGGGGQTDGGSGGTFGLYNSWYADASGLLGPSGGAINYAAVNARGGSGGTGGGGSGGTLDLETDVYFGLLTDGEVALQYGAVDLSGGDGATTGGSGGRVYMFGGNRAENHGSILMGGGEASATAATGGDGCQGNGVEIVSPLGPVLNTALLDCTGGEATGATSKGGKGGKIGLTGMTASDNTGDLWAAGGAASLTDGDGTGGDGNEVTIYARGGPATNSGDIDIAGGEAATPGAHGRVVVGDQDLTATFLP